MADQRPFSRFRLPWVTAAPRPAVEPQTPRPTVEVQVPPQPITTIPQRPFRPGLPSIQSPPPPRVQAPPRTVPQPPPAITESQVGPQPAPLSSATAQTQAASVPSSPTAKTQAASVPSSPTRTKSEGRAVSPTRLPSLPAPQPRAASVPPSPTRTTSQYTQQTVPQPQPTVPQPPSPPRPAVPLLLSQAARQTIGFKPASEPAEREKTDSQAREADKQKQQEKEDKKTTIISSSEEHIKTVSSTQPMARTKSTESHQKPNTSSNGEHVSLPKEIRGDISKFVHKLGVGKLKYPIDDKPVSVVTIAGENTGASMHVGAEPVRKDGSIHIHRGYKLNPDDSTGATTDGEGSTEGRRSKNPTKEDPVTDAYVNSNTQSINNSIVFDSSVNEQSPGVHLSLSHDLAEPNKPSGEPEPPQTHRAEFSVTPAQKLTYEPTIRRRCLRGLFLEPSDSDDNDLEKPRRHGCRYGCGEKSKDKDIVDL